MSKKMRWAILATGAVANRFATALSNITDQAELVAVGSRSTDTAKAFAEKFSIPKYYGSYQEVADDPDVDIVYIGTPHTIHCENTLMSLGGGKHVLCEKAFCMNADEANQMIDMAREKNLFLMEAMWTRFFPIHFRIREILAEGLLGDLQGLVIHHNYMGLEELPEVYPPEWGMGTFMDQAPYGMALAYSILGPPVQTKIITTFGPRGINYQTSGAFLHEGGRMTTWIASRTSYDVKEAVIFGTEGKIDIHDPWYKPTKMTLHIKGKDPKFIEYPLDGFVGYEYEAMEVMNCIKAGKTESKIMSLNETLAIMKSIDGMRAQWEF